MVHIKRSKNNFYFFCGALLFTTIGVPLYHVIFNWPAGIIIATLASPFALFSLYVYFSGIKKLDEIIEVNKKGICFKSFSNRLLLWKHIDDIRIQQIVINAPGSFFYLVVETKQLIPEKNTISGKLNSKLSGGLPIANLNFFMGGTRIAKYLKECKQRYDSSEGSSWELPAYEPKEKYGFKVN